MYYSDENKKSLKINFYAVKKIKPIGLKFPLTFLSLFMETFFPNQR